MIRVGHGFDAHRLAGGRKLILGGVVIPYEKGSLGHSDGDVLAHALADALLGAASLGDLGSYFPESDPQWRDADSMVLLRTCAGKVGEAGFAIGNVDATVVVQQPRLGPHLESMRRSIASALAVTDERVSIKAKSSDGMGYTGDGTGIAAYAVALIERI